MRNKGLIFLFCKKYYFAVIISKVRHFGERKLLGSFIHTFSLLRTRPGVLVHKDLFKERPDWTERIKKESLSFSNGMDYGGRRRFRMVTRGRTTWRNSPCLSVLEKDCQAPREARLMSTPNKIQTDGRVIPAEGSLRDYTSYLKWSNIMETESRTMVTRA